MKVSVVFLCFYFASESKCVVCVLQSQNKSPYVLSAYETDYSCVVGDGMLPYLNCEQCFSIKLGAVFWIPFHIPCSALFGP